MITSKALITPHHESTKKYKPRHEWGGKSIVPERVGRKKYRSRNEWDGKSISPGTSGTVMRTPGKNGR